MYYWAIVHRDEGSAYGVSFPDLPGCFSAADSQDDVVKNAIEALDLYFEGESEMPAPKALEEVAKEFADDLAAGAYLIQVPAITLTTKTVRINLSMDSGLVNAIDSAAKRVGLNRSAYIAQAARREIEAA